MRRIRALTLGLLLTGSLFPSVQGVPINAAAALVAAPLTAFEIVRILPRIHPALFLTIILFVPLIAVGVSVSPPGGTYGAEKFSTLWSATLLSGVAAALIRDRPGLLTFARVWVGIGVVLAVTTILFGTENQGRAEGFGSNPIWLGRAMASAAVFAMWLVWTHCVRKSVAITAILLLASGVMLTGSRGPMLGMLFGAAMLAVFAARRPFLWVFGLISALLGLLWLVQAGRFSAGGPRALNLAFGPDEYRGEMWALSLKVIASSPLGVGFGRWNAATAPWLQFRYPHNLFLEVTEEAGWLPGVIIAGATLSVLLRLAFAARGDTACLLMLCVLTAETIGASLSGDINARTFFMMLTLGYWVLRMPMVTGVSAPGSEVRADPEHIPRKVDLTTTNASTCSNAHDKRKPDLGTRNPS